MDSPSAQSFTSRWQQINTCAVKSGRLPPPSCISHIFTWTLEAGPHCGVVVSTVTWQQKGPGSNPGWTFCWSLQLSLCFVLEFSPAASQSPKSLTWWDLWWKDGWTDREMHDWRNSRGESRVYEIFHKSKFPSKNLSMLNWKKMLKYSNVSSKSRLKPSGCMKETFPEVKLKSELAGRWVTESWTVAMTPPHFLPPNFICFM